MIEERDGVAGKTRNHGHDSTAANGNAIAADSVANPTVQPRRSARLQTDLGQWETSKPSKAPDQALRLPTPLSTDSRPDLKHEQKRKRSTDSAALAGQTQPVKRRRSSPTQGAGLEAGREEAYDPIKHWTMNHRWPEDFAIKGYTMQAPTQRPGQPPANEQSRKRSYSQSVREGSSPVQYSQGYETELGYSKSACSHLGRFNGGTFLTRNPSRNILNRVLQSCRNCNEAKINRDITTLIVPPVSALNVHGRRHFEHLIDEVNADWNKAFRLLGPQIRPDLAIGLSYSLFSSTDMSKLLNYSSMSNWTRFTWHMLYPFLMCEIKCGDDSLTRADRQNMHSCSVAVRAILRLEQEADRFRQTPQLQNLDGRVLVFSISHEHQSAALYGHFPQIVDRASSTFINDRWEYRRYEVKRYSLRNHADFLALRGFVANVLTDFALEHIARIRSAVAVLPEPSAPPRSTVGSDMDFGPVSRSASLGEAVPTSGSAGGFRTPSLPTRVLEEKKQELEERVSQLLLLLDREK